MYVVPVTLNYGVVLEAETLVEDALAEAGKHRYIIEDDEFSRVGRLVDFGRKMLSLDGSMVIRFGQPRDPFGNRVNDDGASVDGQGRAVDIERYLIRADGITGSDPQRDQVYTRDLASALLGDYERLTEMLPTHLAARALYDGIVDMAGTRDVYRLLRLRDTAEVPAAVVHRRVEELVELVDADPAGGLIAQQVRDMNPRQVVDHAIEAWGAYHTRPVAVRRGAHVVATHMPLLYFYRNRTVAIREDRT